MSWVGQPRPLPWHTPDDFGTAAIPAAIGGTREALWPSVPCLLPPEEEDISLLLVVRAATLRP